MIRTVLPVLFCLTLTACPDERSSSARSEATAVEAQQMQFLRGQPVPNFDWSLERDVVIQLYQARNERVATHSVWRSSMGTIDDHCQSIGYPIPADVSLTNPVKGEWSRSNGIAGITIEQPEPNGLFSSKNTYGTWVRCIEDFDGATIEVPVYIESNVTAYPYPVEVDFDTNRVTRKHGAKPALSIQPKAAASAPSITPPARAPLD